MRINVPHIGEWDGNEIYSELKIWYFYADIYRPNGESSQFKWHLRFDLDDLGEGFCDEIGDAMDAVEDLIRETMGKLHEAMDRTDRPNKKDAK